MLDGIALAGWTLILTEDVGGFIKSEEILGAESYHAVVGNPPYITARTRRRTRRIASDIEDLHRQYSLGVPFTERFFDLAWRPPTTLGGLRRADHRQLVHEARVRQEADPGVPARRST